MFELLSQFDFSSYLLPNLHLALKFQDFVLVLKTAMLCYFAIIISPIKLSSDLNHHLHFVLRVVGCVVAPSLRSWQSAASSQLRIAGSLLPVFGLPNRLLRLVPLLILAPKAQR